MGELQSASAGDLRLLILNSQEPNVNAHLSHAVASGFAAALSRERVHLARYADACAMFRKARCNALLLFDGQGIRQPIVQELLRLSPRNILWVTEDPYELAANVRHAEAFDLVFTNDAGSIADYRGKAHHMPLAAGSVAEPVPLEQRYRDVFFAGVAWPNRVAIFRELIPRLKGLNTQFLLPYNEHLPKPDLPLPECEWNVRLAFADLLTAARYSKIVLYLERDFSSSGCRGRALSPANRLFEIAALGVAQIAIGDEATIRPYFEPGKEILVARTADEAAELIRTLLADPARLLALGQAARDRVLAEHLYSHRAQAILGHLATVPQRKPTKPKPARLRLVLVANGVRGQRPWGGTELHVDQLCRRLGHKYDIHLLYSSPQWNGRSLVHRQIDSGRERTLYAGPYDPFRTWVDPPRDAAFQKLLVEEQIDLVHFVHFLSNSFGFAEVAKTLGRPTVMGLHDFFIACPQFNLLDASGRFCNVPAIETCDQCLARLDGLPHGAQAQRRELLSRVCATVDKIHFVSHSQRALIERVMPIPAEKAFVQGVGIHLTPTRSVSEDRLADASGWCEPQSNLCNNSGLAASIPAPPPLRVAAIGNHASNKGAETLIALVQQLASEKIEFHIAGTIEDGFKARLESLAGDSVKLLGPYEPEQVGAILRDCHAAVFASPWPETFMLTLSEAFHAGAVPIGPDLGAFGERVRDGENGLVVRGDVGGYFRALLSLLDNPHLLERLRAGTLATPVPSIEEDAAGFERVYDELAAEYGLPGASFPASLESEEFVPLITAAAGIVRQETVRPVESALTKAMRIYRTHGARAVLRRAWQRTSGWIRSH